MLVSQSDSKFASKKFGSRSRPNTQGAGGAWLPLRSGASGLKGPGADQDLNKPTREAALAQGARANPRLKAAAAHTWTWASSMPGSVDEDIPNMTSLGPFQAVLHPPEDVSTKQLAGFLSKSPLTPARCRSTGPVTKGLDSLLLSSVMEQHHESLAERMLDPSPRARAKRAANASPTHLSRAPSTIGADPNDWQSRPANVDVQYLSGKIPPLHSEQGLPPPTRSDSVVPGNEADYGNAAGNVLGAAVHEWGPVGAFQWAPAPSRLQAWRRTREALEPGSKAYRKQMEELQRVDMLVRSFKRAANPSTLQAEGRAHYRAGIIFDNLHLFPKAIERYAQFLDSAKQIGDVEGVAVAHNCMAVAHQRDAEAQTAPAPAYDDDDDDEAATRVSTSAQMRYEKALENHLKHLEIADTAGQLVAHTNLGLMSTMLGQKEAAAYSHEQAIKCAVQLSDMAAERAAVGNLAFLLLGEERYEESKPFLERYVSVCCAAGDGRGQAEGHLGLGRCARALHELKQASDAFESALRAAQDAGDQSLFNQAKVLLGIARGELKYVEMTSSKQLPLGYQATALKGPE